MAHYALLDENNMVLQVITGRNENEVVNGISDWEAHYSEVTGLVAKRTSYNTLANKHKLNGEPYRGNYAGVGYTFFPELGDDGVFLPPKPFDSWILDTNQWVWLAPIPRPDYDNVYFWDEKINNWKIFS